MNGNVRNAIEPESAGMKPLYKDRIPKASSVFVCRIVLTVSNGCDRITAVAPYDAPDAMLLRKSIIMCSCF